MKNIFDACVPRDEVLQGELREQQFAASLTRVLRGTADPVYGDAATFFANTFATSGLKALLREGLGRISGTNPGSSPVIRLETSFGGGKTHNLIALYHLCRGDVDPQVDLLCCRGRTEQAHGHGDDLVQRFDAAVKFHRLDGTDRQRALREGPECSALQGALIFVAPSIGAEAAPSASSRRQRRPDVAASHHRSRRPRPCRADST